MSAVTRWWWVRHAPVARLAGRLYGQTDLDADCADAATFDALARRLPGEAVWVTSHLKRTAQTAAALAAAGAPVVVVGRLPELAEQAFGRWQGLTWDEIRERDEAAHREFWTDPGRGAPPDGESFAAVVTRVAAAVDRLTADFVGRDIVAVGHAGTIRAALVHALAIEPVRGLALQIDTLSLTRIEHAPERSRQGHRSPWRVVAVNQPAR